MLYFIKKVFFACKSMIHEYQKKCRTAEIAFF